MSREHKFAFTCDFGLLGEQSVLVAFYYTRGRPVRMFLANGDPGYPEEPAMAEITSVLLFTKEHEVELIEKLPQDALEELSDKCIEVMELEEE